MDLDTILRMFRQENVDQDTETRMVVTRRHLLRGALKAVRRPDFCFRNTPMVAFRGEEASGHRGTLREFFRFSSLPQLSVAI